MKRLPLCFGLAALAALGGCALTAERATVAAEDPQVAIDTHLLLADIAVERREFGTVAEESLAAARLSKSPVLAERATRVAHELELTAQGLEAAGRWVELAPDDERPLWFLGVFEMQSNRIDRSVAAFERFVRNFGDTGNGLALVHEALTREPNTAVATAIMRSLTSTFPNTATGYFSLARLAMRSGDFETALDNAEAAARVEPDSIDAQLLLARTLMVVGRTEDGLAIAARLANGNDNLEIGLQYSELLLAAGRTLEAETRLNQILDDNPGLPAAVRALAFLSLNEERLDEAERHFSTLARQPNFREEAQYYLGRIAEAERRFQDAVRAYQRVINGSHAVEAQLRAARIMSAENRDPEGAVQHLRDFGEGNPGFRSDMLVAQAQLLLQLNRLDEAMRVFDEALAATPDDPELQAAHSQLYAIVAQDASQRGLLDQAESVLEQGLARYAGHPDLRYAQALLYQEQGRMRRSADVLESLVDDYPENAAFLNALGYLLTDSFNRHEEARGYIQRALAQPQSADSAAIIDSMGWVLYKLGDYEAAIGYLERAYRLEPEGEIAAHLVDARWALGEKTRALELLQIELERNPGNRHLLEVAERLTR